MISRVPPGKPNSIAITGGSSETIGGRGAYSTGELRLISAGVELKFDNAWVFVSLHIEQHITDTGPRFGDVLIDDLNVEPLRQSIIDGNLSAIYRNKWKSLPFALLWVATPLVTVWGIYRCLVGSLESGRKVLVVIFSVFGFTRLWLDLTHGEWFFRISRWSYFGVGWHKGGPFADIYLFVSVPVGALLVLVLSGTSDRSH